MTVRPSAEPSEQYRPPIPADDDQISFAEIVIRARAFGRRCLQRRRVFFMAWAGGLAIGLAYLFIRTPNYTVYTKILPYRQQDAGLGGLGGLASLAGVQIPIGGGGQVVTADLYPEVANSQMFRARLAKSTLQFTDGPHTYEEYFERVYSPRLIEATAIHARRLKSALTGEGSSASGRLTRAQLDSLGLVEYSVPFLRLLNDMRHRVQTSMDRKTSVITIQADMPDPIAAADLAKLASNQLTREIVAYESRKATELANSLREQQAIAEVRYRAAQAAVTDFRDRNRTMGVQAQAAFDRLETEFELAAELYKNVSTQLEIAKVKQQENTPVLTVIEPGVVPHSPSSPRKLGTLITVLMLSTVGTLAYLLVEPLVRPKATRVRG